jgi:hypothetical protein
MMAKPFCSSCIGSRRRCQRSWWASVAHHRCGMGWKGWMEGDFLAERGECAWAVSKGFSVPVWDQSLRSDGRGEKAYSKVKWG